MADESKETMASMVPMVPMEPSSEVVAETGKELDSVTEGGTESVPAAAKASDTEDDTTTEQNDGDDDDADWLMELGFLFEGNEPTRREHFCWQTPDGRPIDVVLDSAEGDPGDVASGMYLWPAAKLLAQYIVQEFDETQQASSQPNVVLELGAGCALCSCAAWQLFANTLQCLLVTDRDRGTLERARNNHETTLEGLLDIEETEDDLNFTINNLGSIPTCFEPLEWGHARDIEAAQTLIAEHSVPHQRHADYILASDLISDIALVEPLLRTARAFMAKNDDYNDSSSNVTSMSSRFLLAQSFAYDAATEAEIDKCCSELGLQRTVLVELEDGKQRIQEFRLS